MVGLVWWQASLIKLAAEEARWLFDGLTDPQAISKSLPQHPAILVTDGGLLYYIYIYRVDQMLNQP
jgi:hypothetical protein